MRNPLVTPEQIDMLNNPLTSDDQFAWKILGHVPSTDYFIPENKIQKKLTDNSIYYEDRFETYPPKQMV